MKIRKKEVAIGLMLALVVAIFISYSYIERLFDASRPIDIQGVYPLLYSLIWYFLLSIIYFLYCVSIFKLYQDNEDRLIKFLLILFGIAAMSYIMSILYPIVREFFAPEGVIFRRPRQMFMEPGPGALTITIFNHLVVLTLDVLFFYILRLLYANHDIVRRNEQLELETVKSQHEVLVQQINPHFFFNSLNSLRYIILKNDNEKAVDYLDNLTGIFRKTLKASANKYYTLSEEMELSLAYAYIVESRFSGKLFIKFDIKEEHNSYGVAPLALLTLMENVVKHNKIGSKEPIYVNIFTTESNTLVVENNVVPKFEEVEKSGIGIENLNQRYQLLIDRGIDVESSSEFFRVTLPLIVK